MEDPREFLSSPWKRPEPENKENESPDDDICPLDLSTYDKPLFQKLEDKRCVDMDADNASGILYENIPNDILQQYYTESKGKRAMSPVRVVSNFKLKLELQ